MNNKEVVEHNSKSWDKQVEEGTSDWTKAVSSKDIEKARMGKVELYLTPTKPVPQSWYPKLKGCRILCLASGGGQQGPILAAAGAIVTVFDNSDKQLETDKMVAKRDKLIIETIKGDMRDLSVFDDATFDMIIHPVSNVFVPDIIPVWKEASRVLKKGGLLLSGFTNPVVYLFDEMDLCNNKLTVTHKIPYSPFNVDAKGVTDIILKYGGSFEFGHTLEDQLAGQINAGLVITGLYEDTNRENAKCLLDDYISYYMATKAIKI